MAPEAPDQSLGLEGNPQATAAQPGQQINGQVTDRSPHPFRIVAQDAQRPHVHGQVNQPEVDETGREQAPPLAFEHRQGGQAAAPIQDLCELHRDIEWEIALQEALQEWIADVVAPGQEEAPDKHGDIEADQHPGHDGPGWTDQALTDDAAPVAGVDGLALLQPLQARWVLQQSRSPDRERHPRASAGIAHPTGDQSIQVEDLQQGVEGFEADFALLDVEPGMPGTGSRLGNQSQQDLQVAGSHEQESLQSGGHLSS